MTTTNSTTPQLTPTDVLEPVLEPESNPASTKTYPEVNSWDEFDMDALVLRGIYSFGYEKPSPIQRKAILPMIDGRDMIAQAQSGTGKTGTFSIGTLNLVDPTQAVTQAIILSPTRELTKQSANVVSSIGTFVDGLRVQILVGGTSTFDDMQKLKEQPPHVVVGCPGRTYDMIKRGHLRTDNVKLMVLDEADEMLSHGFKDQMYQMFQQLNSTCQIALFSATMPPDIESLSQKFMRDPVKILVKSEMLTLEGIQQHYIALDNDGLKFDTLKDLYNSLSVSQCIIYCNSTERVEDLYEAMIQDDFSVSRIHSGMTREERDAAYEDFKSGRNRVLISSNVTARGIDVQQVSVVINFDVPKCVHTYLHRIGRSGRWGRKGTGINFVTKFDIKYLKQIEEHYSTQITELPASFVQ
jgi:translation initiation factor 4A